MTTKAETASARIRTPAATRAVRTLDGLREDAIVAGQMGLGTTSGAARAEGRTSVGGEADGFGSGADRGTGSALPQPPQKCSPGWVARPHEPQKR